jgi:putative transposase
MGKGRKNGTTTTEDPELDRSDWRVQIALDEIAPSAHEGLLALAVGAGLQVTQALTEDDVTAACVGPRAAMTPIGPRPYGHQPGSATLGERRAPTSRPRVRAADGSGELPSPSYEEFAGTEVLGRVAMERMLRAVDAAGQPRARR